jgi:ribonuclease HI
LHHLHVDGGARGNPGPAAIGAVLEDGHGNRLATISRTIGRATNNIAEYSALISGLEMALEHGVEELAVFSDSELVIRQLKGEYKVKNQGLKPLYDEAMERLGRFDRYELNSIPRVENAHADELVNQALDAAAG